MCRIDAMIIGTQKAGTTSFAYYLSQHPRIMCHIDRGLKEFSFFIEDRISSIPFDDYFLESYLRHPEQDELVLAKNVSIMFSPEAVRRLRDHNPDCKLIVMLRNPIDRAYSSFWYEKFRGSEVLETFEEAILGGARNEEVVAKKHHRPYLTQGLYFEQLTTIEKVFDGRRPLVILLEDLKDSPHDVIQQTFEFLHIQQYDIETNEVVNPAKAVRSPRLAQLVYNQSYAKSLAKKLIPLNVRRRIRNSIQEMNSYEQKPPKMKQTTRERMIEYYRPHNDRLCEYIGRDLSAWNK